MIGRGVDLLDRERQIRGARSQLVLVPARHARHARDCVLTNEAMLCRR
jgi:hypothetical protein